MNGASTRISDGPNIVSLFAGAGGLSSGFKSAGLNPVVAVEINRDAAKTYRRNVGSECLERDIADLNTLNEVAAFIANESPFAIIGGPPCQGFSTAGARDPSDPRNKLIFAYLAFVSRLRPRWVVFENVEGLLTANDGLSIRDFVSELVALDYWVSLRKVNFAALGVPEARKRVIVVANRLGVAYEFPSERYAFEGKKHRGSGELGGPTLGDALSGLGPVSIRPDFVSPYSAVEPASEYDQLMRDGNLEEGTRQHSPIALAKDDAERAAALQPGQSIKDLPEHLWPDSYRSRAFRRVADGMPTAFRGGAPSGLRRLQIDHASLTITSLSPREFIHPFENRGLTLRECARIQSFPDRYVFEGNASSVSLQIGNAFPPLAARAFARSLMQQDDGRDRKPSGVGRARLLSYHLTDSNGRSPALQRTEIALAALTDKPIPTQPTLIAPILEDDPLSKLSIEQKAIITRARVAEPVRMSDRELIRLIAIIFHDLNRDDLIPEWARLPADYSTYYHLALSWFTQDDQRRIDALADHFLAGVDQIADFVTVFKCLAEVHKRRRKYDLILKAQMQPTMDQVAKKGLLEYGLVKSPALTSWLVWRKWIYDIDNRSAQETGYLFEPILAQALGGAPYGSRNSPVKRRGTKGGRQVDCLIDADGERRAYEFKVRLTIASSGQGRFGEELSFPEEAQASGFVPVLMVLDPTENDKMTQLIAAFKGAGGEAYIGDAAWSHIAERAGETMATFVTKYVREPLNSIADEWTTDQPLDLRMQWDVAGQQIIIRVGEQEWKVDRRIDATISDEVAQLDEDD